MMVESMMGGEIMYNRVTGRETVQPDHCTAVVCGQLLDGYLMLCSELAFKYTDIHTTQKYREFLTCLSVMRVPDW